MEGSKSILLNDIPGPRVYSHTINLPAYPQTLRCPSSWNPFYAYNGNGDLNSYSNVVCSTSSDYYYNCPRGNTQTRMGLLNVQMLVTGNVKWVDPSVPNPIPLNLLAITISNKVVNFKLPNACVYCNHHRFTQVLHDPFLQMSGTTNTIIPSNIVLTYTPSGSVTRTNLDCAALKVSSMEGTSFFNSGYAQLGKNCN